MSEKNRKAWEMARDIFESSEPAILDSGEQTWEENEDVSDFYDQNLSLDWGSNVPGSGAPEKIMVASIQALENRGYRVSDKAYEYLEMGLKAFDRKDFDALHRYSALLRRELAEAEKDEESDYWKHHFYSDFSEYASSVTFPEKEEADLASPDYRDRVTSGWLSQLIGGAMGTCVEGYSSTKLYKAFGDIYDFPREPNTFNDDTTYELAFLEAFSEHGFDVGPEDIALSWVGLIPCGWSAEEIALRNIKNGIFPPESAGYRNPFSEWIGAQMRGGICGMVAPGDPEAAAELAWKDGSVSHINNGILGEVFIAVMTSMAFVKKDARDILRTAIPLIPEDSEYRSVLDLAWESCEKHSDWHDALAECCERYKKYNWIHAYPNACCDVIALYYGKGDFTETLHIITVCGLDADCNAGMIMPLIGIMGGKAVIPERYMHPAFAKLTTYMRGEYRALSLDEIVDRTVEAAIKACKDRPEL